MLSFSGTPIPHIDCSPPPDLDCSLTPVTPDIDSTRSCNLDEDTDRYLNKIQYEDERNVSDIFDSSSALFSYRYRFTVFSPIIKIF